MHGVLGRDGWSPLNLVAIGRDEVLRYGGVVEPRAAVSVERDGPYFVATLDDGTVRSARRLLFASGLRDELPAIPGLAEHWGRGVAHCPYCHGWEVRDTRIAVIATGPASLHQAQLVRQLSPMVTYFVEGTDLPEPRLAALVARGIQVETRRIAAALDSGGTLSGLRVHDGAELGFDAVFVRPRAIPGDELLHALGAESVTAADGHPWVIVDATGRTSVPGVWAAGNVIDPSATVPVSAAAGSSTGAAINADLVEDEVQSALRAHTR
jgi:thioredoxin reductase